MHAAHENPVLDLATVPRLDLQDLSPLDPRIIMLRTAIAAGIDLVLLIIIAVLSVMLIGGTWAVLITLAALVFFLVSIAVLRISLGRWGYVVRAHDVTVRRGIYVRSVTSVPFNRVQHAAVRSGPLERAAGLASVVVYTAGGGVGALAIPGLGKDDADRLKDLVLLAVAAVRAEPSPGDAEVPSGPPLLDPGDGPASDPHETLQAPPVPETPSAPPVAEDPRSDRT